MQTHKKNTEVLKSLGNFLEELEEKYLKKIGNSPDRARLDLVRVIKGYVKEKGFKVELANSFHCENYTLRRLPGGNIEVTNSLDKKSVEVPDYELSSRLEELVSF